MKEFAKPRRIGSTMERLLPGSVGLGLDVLEPLDFWGNLVGRLLCQSGGLRAADERADAEQRPGHDQLPGSALRDENHKKVHQCRCAQTLRQPPTGDASPRLMRKRENGAYFETAVTPKEFGATRQKTDLKRRRSTRPNRVETRKFMAVIAINRGCQGFIKWGRSAEEWRGRRIVA